MIRVEGIKTFEELLAKHGKGYGCEVCKPTVGSLLASCWNEYILKPEHTPLQDSNDNFLANIQKDGTYSVIPRSPGGEITPEGLMAVGRIAREFNLYTKITGSQRLAMFGAQKDDLPEIWRQLIEAASKPVMPMRKHCVWRKPAWVAPGAATALATASASAWNWKTATKASVRRTK